MRMLFTPAASSVLRHRKYTERRPAVSSEIWSPGERGLFRSVTSAGYYDRYEGCDRYDRSQEPDGPSSSSVVNLRQPIPLPSRS
jgi:hypothetical protein